MLSSFRTLAALLLFGALVPPLSAAPVVCRSPDAALSIEFDLRPNADGDAIPHYRIAAGATEVVAWSRLGVDLDAGILGGPCRLVGSETRAIRDRFTQFPGKRTTVVGNGSETTIRLEELAEPKRAWEVVVRAYDDGVAFRYRFPAQTGWKQLVVAGERTQFHFPVGTKGYALPLNGFTTSHEKRYERKLLADLPADYLLGLPLLVERPGGGFAAVTEADIDEYAGMYLRPLGGNLPGLAARLSPLPKEPKVAVRWTLPHASPWRVVMVADRAGRLIESDLVLNLSQPRAIEDVSWIEPGKTTFPWWNGYFEQNVPFKPGLNTATMKHYIDFCAEAGIPYHSLDGVGSTAWYSGPIVPYKGADPTKALPEIDLPEVLKYAKAKGVRLRLWMNWKAAEAHMERAFPLYREWGIEGVMLDFMDRDDQEMNRFVRKAVKLAADNRLTVTLHGCPQPTGLERTYPNLLTHEGVMNLEYDKWDKLGIPPEHEVTVPFTRMLAGPLDFHQGSLRTVEPKAFVPRNEAPLVMGTPCRTLASYVVYQNHLSMVADYPSAYRGHPALPILAAIPATWDDTKVVVEKVGESVAVARRKGEVWHVGAMNDREPRTLVVPLKFLGPGRFAVEIQRDDAAAERGMSRRGVVVSATDELRIDLAGAGGAYVKISPAK